MVTHMLKLCLTTRILFSPICERTLIKEYGVSFIQGVRVYQNIFWTVVTNLGNKNIKQKTLKWSLRAVNMRQHIV